MLMSPETIPTPQNPLPTLILPVLPGLNQSLLSWGNLSWSPLISSLLNPAVWTVSLPHVLVPYCLFTRLAELPHEAAWVTLLLQVPYRSLLQ